MPVRMPPTCAHVPGIKRSERAVLQQGPCAVRATARAGQCWLWHSSAKLQAQRPPMYASVKPLRLQQSAIMLFVGRTHSVKLGM